MTDIEPNSTDQDPALRRAVELELEFATMVIEKSIDASQEMGR